jgi:hypothetical protein
MSNRTELDKAAANVIDSLKKFDDYSNAEIAIIGGLAVWNYFPNGRSTEVLNGNILTANIKLIWLHRVLTSFSTSATRNRKSNKSSWLF